MEKSDLVILRWVAIVLIPVVAGLALILKDVVTTQSQQKPDINGYVQPSDLGDWIDVVRERTVTIKCNLTSGSGFSFALVKSDNAKWNFSNSSNSQSILITNYHVVKNCTGKLNSVEVLLDNSTSTVAKILKVDKKNDLAAISIPKTVEPLVGIYYKPFSGYWVMAIGSPFNLEGTTTFGNIINIEGNRIYTSASLNKGNSGGPLIDNEGFVVGINTGYRAVAQNLNWATDINALCDEIVTCNSKDGLLHPVK